MKRSPLRRSRPKAWRRADADRVTPADHAYVIARDRCVAAALGASDRCRDTWGNLFDPHKRPDLLEVDHIREAPMLGKRGMSHVRWMAGACPWHHRLGNPPWMTSNRAAVRAYLAVVENDEEQVA